LKASTAKSGFPNLAKDMPKIFQTLKLLGKTLTISLA
jgi:hypothetical protein